jgi:hypothetical protein
MPSKKKPRLLFEVPAETEPGAQSGWVYRSEAERPETFRHESAARHEPAAAPLDSGVLSMSATTAALSMAVIAQTFALFITVAAIPLTMALRTLGALTKPGDAIE